MATNLAAAISSQQLADILPVAFAIVNRSDEQVFANRRFRDLQLSAEGTTFSHLSETVHPEDRTRVEASYRETLQSKCYLRTEYRTCGEGNPWRALILEPLSDEDAARFSLRGGGGFICTIADITADKAAEMAQMKIAQEAHNRKEQQEKFIDMISHEVRNPLSAVLHCTEDILEAVRDEASQAALTMRITEAAETIALCVGHQRKIIDDVLMFSKLDAAMLTLLPRSVQPTRHLCRSLTMFQPELRRQNIQFEYVVDHCYVDAGIQCVVADIHRMGQVLINLVSNAIKYTSEAHGERKIRVSMGASRVRPPSYPPNVVFFRSTETALRLDETSKPEWGTGELAYIMVAVKDSGIGISDQHQKRLFERFNQVTPRTDRIYGGFGLGLNVSQKLCHLHGGEIGVSSKEGYGSTFGFFFAVRRCTDDAIQNEPVPQSHTAIEELCRGIQDLGNEMSGVNRNTDTPKIPQSPPVAYVKEMSPAAPTDDRKKHTLELARQVDQDALRKSTEDPDGPMPNRPQVLLVEDNIINQQIMARKLRLSGFDVTEASNGQEALDAYQRGAFDCILMDQQMPIMDGNTATRVIRSWEQQTGKHVRVLGVTANVRPEQQEEMLDAGMDQIIHKPYKMQELCDKIRGLIDLKI